MKKFTRDFPKQILRKSFIGDFQVKLKVSFEFFTRDFPGKKGLKSNFWKHFTRDFPLENEEIF